MKRLLLVLLVLCCAASLLDAEPSTGTEALTEEHPFVNKDFLVAASEKTYEGALAVARRLEKEAGIRLDLRGLTPNKETMLTITRKDCEENGWEWPMYYARGRFDDGVYASIEHTSGYPESLTPGLFIVVAAHGNRKDKEMGEACRRVRSIIPSAYWKAVKIYVGCMH